MRTRKYTLNLSRNKSSSHLKKKYKSTNPLARIKLQGSYGHSIADVDWVNACTARVSVEITEAKISGVLEDCGFGCYHKKCINYYHD